MDTMEYVVAKTAEYAVAKSTCRRTDIEMVDAVHHMKRNRIVAKPKGKYWRTMHDFRVCVPHCIEETLRFDEETGTDF